MHSWLQLRPNFADAWSNLASAYMRKGRLDEASQCCRQALALNPLLVYFCLTWFYDDLAGCLLDGLEEKKIYNFSALYCLLYASNQAWMVLQLW